MSKQIKANCEKMITKLGNKLEELKVSIKMKKSQNILQKQINQLINDYKFFSDQFKVISFHHSYLQNKNYQQEGIISQYQSRLLSHKAEKKMIEKMMKSKFEKLTKEQQFLEFAGKVTHKRQSTHQRSKSQLVKKAVNDLDKDILDSNKRVSSRANELRYEIQTEEQEYQTLKDHKKMISEIKISPIKPKKSHSPARTLTKKEGIKKILIQQKDDITAYKTGKKQLTLKQQQKSRQMLKQKQANSAQTVVIKKKKKEELAEIIAQQARIIVAKEKYFSTDI